METHIQKFLGCGNFTTLGLAVKFLFTSGLFEALVHPCHPPSGGQGANPKMKKP